MGADTTSRRTGDGFSLIEILIVIVILGVLATVVVFSVRGVSQRGELASCDEDRRVLQTAAESYFAQRGVATIAVSDPAVDGVSGPTPEQTLVEVGLLVNVSMIHDVAVDGEVTPTAGGPCT